MYQEQDGRVYMLGINSGRRVICQDAKIVGSLKLVDFSGEYMGLIYLKSGRFYKYLWELIFNVINNIKHISEYRFSP